MKLVIKNPPFICEYCILVVNSDNCLMRGCESTRNVHVEVLPGWTVVVVVVDAIGIPRKSTERGFSY